MLSMGSVRAVSQIERSYLLARGLIPNLSLGARAVVVGVDPLWINLGSSLGRRSLLQPIQQLNIDCSHSLAFVVWKACPAHWSCDQTSRQPLFPGPPFYSCEELPKDLPAPCTAAPCCGATLAELALFPTWAGNWGAPCTHYDSRSDLRPSATSAKPLVHYSVEYQYISCHRG